MEGSVKIREMTLGDYPGVRALWESIKGMAIRSMDDSEEGVKRFLERNPGTSVVAVDQKKDDMIVGAILCGNDGREGRLYHVCVAEAYRRQGIGRQMVTECADKLKKLKVNKISLVAFSDNNVGNEFWHDTGWRDRGDCNCYDLVLNENNLIRMNRE
ncbi:MAG: GNAT family N-acetyltransferase [Lachnospiraceae bacterium]|nr:GNAT family N-acetyltransferase [Lachnospiraceae bacterium]